MSAAWFNLVVNQLNISLKPDLGFGISFCLRLKY